MGINLLIHRYHSCYFRLNFSLQLEAWNIRYAQQNYMNSRCFKWEGSYKKAHKNM